jgi:hypothetical protein
VLVTVGHKDCNKPAAAAVLVVVAGTVAADHTWAVSMHHTVPAAAEEVVAACKDWLEVGYTAAEIGAADGSTGGLGEGNDGDFGLEGCTLPVVGGHQPEVKHNHNDWKGVEVTGGIDSKTPLL